MKRKCLASLLAGLMLALSVNMAVFADPSAPMPPPPPPPMTFSIELPCMDVGYLLPYDVLDVAVFSSPANPMPPPPPPI